jgi:hypothetical protein
MNRWTSQSSNGSFGFEPATEPTDWLEANAVIYRSARHELLVVSPSDKPPPYAAIE